jgi:hypothetical protein
LLAANTIASRTSRTPTSRIHCRHKDPAAPSKLPTKIPLFRFCLMRPFAQREFCPAVTARFSIGTL